MSIKEITKKEAEEAYEKNDIVKAAKELGMSVPTMYKLLKHFKIALKGRKGNGRRKFLIIND